MTYNRHRLTQNQVMATLCWFESGQGHQGARARVAELVDARDSKSRSARSGGSIPSTGTTKAFHRCSPCTISESNQSLNRCDSQEGRASDPLFLHIGSARIST